MATKPLSASNDKCSEWLGLKMALLFLSTRAARSAPRVIISIATLLILAFALTHVFFPYRLSEALDYSQVINWAKSDGNMVEWGGGLRIVVFGETDIATPPPTAQSAPGGKSWAELLCDELECSSYHSFVPWTGTAPSRSIVSNGLYDRALRNLITKTRDSKQAGMNYTFLEQYYSPPSHLADLESQISQFLAMKQTEAIPNETIYIFSLGTWDIWNLAGFPLATAYETVEDMVGNLFSQIEDLYHESGNPESVAFSASINHTTRVVEPQKTFRIIIPRLFDPSLAPGWKMRITPPHPHSNSEQLKNSAYLTLKWNQEVSKRAQEWMAGEEAPHLVSRSANRESESVTEVRVLSRPPLRDAIVPDLGGYLLDTIIDGQLKSNGILDRTPGSNLGNRPKPDSFDDVKSACISSEEVLSEFKMSTNEHSRTCNQNLFLFDYTITQRAIKQIGAMTAELVVNNKSLRLEWEHGRRGANVWTKLVSTRKGKGANAKMFNV